MIFIRCLLVPKILPEAAFLALPLQGKQERYHTSLKVFILFSVQNCQVICICRAEMHVSIRAEVELKNSKLMKLCEKYEANIKSYTELCDAGEKLMYFGKSLNSPEERSKAKQLLQEFK
jgi:hypothetical protein